MCVLVGCADGAYEPAGGREFDYEKAQTIRVGASQRSVVDALGAPLISKSIDDGAMELTYSSILERRSGIEVFAVRLPVGRQQREQRAVFVIRASRVIRASVTDELL